MKDSFLVGDEEKLRFQRVLQLLHRYHFLFEGIGTCFWGFNRLDDFREVLGCCFIAQGRYYFLCHIVS